MVDANLGIKRWPGKKKGEIRTRRVIDRGGARERHPGHRVIIGTFLARGGGKEGFRGQARST